MPFQTCRSSQMLFPVFSQHPSDAGISSCSLQMWERMHRFNHSFDRDKHHSSPTHSPFQMSVFLTLCFPLTKRGMNYMTLLKIPLFLLHINKHNSLFKNSSHFAVLLKFQALQKQHLWEVHFFQSFGLTLSFFVCSFLQTARRKSMPLLSEQLPAQDTKSCRGCHSPMSVKECGHGRLNEFTTVCEGADRAIWLWFQVGPHAAAWF